MKIITIAAAIIFCIWIGLAYVSDIAFKSFAITIAVAIVAMIIHIVVKFVRNGNC